MHKIIKPDFIVKSDDVVVIPDVPVQIVTECEETVQQPVARTTYTVSPNEVYESMIQRAEAEAKKLSEKFLKYARIERETILQQANDEANKIKEQAAQMREQYKQEGYEQGTRIKAEELDSCISEVRNTLKELRSMQREYLKLYEKELKNLSIDIASKVLSKRITADELEMTQLVEHAVSSVKGADWISVEISDKLPKLVSHLEKELANKDYDVDRIDVKAKDMPFDSCIIQTSDGVINASISEQLNNLKEYFNSLDD